MMVKIKRLLIANRGEIACRVARTARQMKMQTAAIFAPGEKGALHTRITDAALPLPAGKKSPYLNINAIVSRAKKWHADAVHPGCGFLSENTDFAKACAKAGLVFVGPSPQVMTMAGSKILARKLAHKAGAQVLPGAAVSANNVLTAAKRIGFPIMLKAAAGGGGRGMRVVYDEGELSPMLRRAQREAQNAFGDGALMMEKHLANARHLEVQILADKNGNILTLGERDCSMQRRHQKIIEESPAPLLNEKLRRELHTTARNIAAAAKYENAGTVEFLLDENSGKLYFLEINARLQVEHPLTEELFALDLVEWQLRIASGESLPKTMRPPQTAPSHAIEARVCSENPLRNLLPCAGNISRYQLPQMSGIRFDSGVAEGEHAGGEYDSLLMKVIATGNDREQARNKLINALSKTRIDGVETNIPLLIALAESAPFVKGKTQTATAEKIYDGAINIVRARRRNAVMRAAAWLAQTSPCPAACFRLNDIRRASVVLHDSDECHHCNIEITGDECKVNGITLPRAGGEVECARVGGNRISIFCDGMSFVMNIGEPPREDNDAGGGGNVAFAPMPGVVREIGARVGGKVGKGDMLVVLEAMKMEVAVAAPCGGRLAEVFCKIGEVVSAGAALARVDIPPPAPSQRKGRTNSAHPKGRGE